MRHARLSVVLAGALSLTACAARRGAVGIAAPTIPTDPAAVDAVVRELAAAE